MTTASQQNGGRLFYLMGPSGAGKDSLLDACRGQRVAGHWLQVAPRHITRRSEAGGENHIALTPAAFQQSLDDGLFALHWQANGRLYGIGIEIDHWLAAGDAVLVNGSRAYLDEARARYGNVLVPVMVCVAPGIQRQRLLERGRETPEEIEARIERSIRLQDQLGDELATVQNDGTLADATARLKDLILRHLPETELLND